MKAKAPSQLPKLVALEQLLAIAQMRVSVTAACAAKDGADVLEWRGSAAAKSRVAVAGSEWTKSVTLILDGFFVLRARGQRLFFFVEVDLGTEQKVLAEKAEAYFAYWQSGGFARDYEVPHNLACRVLFVLPTAKRLQVTLKAVEKLLKGQGIFWMALDSNVTPETRLRGHWLTTASQVPKALVP